MRLIFAGTPEPAVPTLRCLLESPRHEVVAVLTRPPARAGRGRSTTPSPVARVAAEAGLPVLQPARASDPDFLATLSGLAPDACVVVAYGALLRPEALSVPKHGWVNLHFSVLPAWRGAAPVQHAILHGDDITGATTFLIDEGLDTGPVFGVVTELITATDTAGDLLARLSVSGARLVATTMDGIEDGLLVPVPQSADGVSLAPKINVEDAHVRWSQPGRHIERQIRACTPAPGAWSTFRGARIKVGPVRMRRTRELPPGQVAAGRSEVVVGTGTTDVELGSVQPAGKRPSRAADWARGVRVQAGEHLG